MSDVTINGTQFRCGRLPTRAQWHVVRRLMPVMQGMMPVLSMINQPQQLTNGVEGDGTMVPGVADTTVFEAIAALSNTIGMLSDADADYIIDNALACVLWRQGNHWSSLRAPGGAFLNGAADEFDVQLRLVWEVLRESLSNFSSETLFPSQTANGRDQAIGSAA